MTTNYPSEDPPPSRVEIPQLDDLGHDLLELTRGQVVRTIGAPVAALGAFVAFAVAEWWIPAVFSLAALNFFSYASTSHELVHRNLGLSEKLNDLWLAILEGLCVRSGHAYQLVHLHHHRSFPSEDDVEGYRPSKSFLAALAHGPIFQIESWIWAWRRSRKERGWLLAEAVWVVGFLAGAVALFPVTPIPVVHTGIIVVSSWLFPLFTVYFTHDPTGPNELFQTRAFRGRLFSILFLEHLYHLEHHLYPRVPHHHWPKLARTLDPVFEAAGVRPIRGLASAARRGRRRG